MIIAEMTPKQLQYRNEFIQSLIAQGWDPGGWEILFQSGANLVPEAQAEYNNSDFLLRLSYFVKEDYIFLECVGIIDPTILKLRFYGGKNLLPVVAQISKGKNTLSPDNYVDFIETMLPLCKLVALETPQGLIRIS